MGLLDQPLISEMDGLEQAAAKGDAEALEMILRTLPAHKRLFIRRQIDTMGASQREALERAGIIMCIRRSPSAKVREAFSINAKTT